MIVIRLGYRALRARLLARPQRGPVGCNDLATQRDYSRRSMTDQTCTAPIATANASMIRLMPQAQKKVKAMCLRNSTPARARAR